MQRLKITRGSQKKEGERGMRMILQELRAIKKLLLDIKNTMEQKRDKKILPLDFSDIEFKSEQDKVKFLQRLEAIIKHLSAQRK